MRNRLLVAIGVGIIAAGAGAVMAMRMGEERNALGIAIATGAVGFLLGLLFKFRWL